jgi:hypothetical protein
MPRPIRPLVSLIVALGGLPGAAAAQSELMTMLDPVLGRQTPRTDYRITYYPEERVEGQPADLGFIQHRVSATVPFGQDTRNEWTASTTVRYRDVDTRALLPDTGVRFPRELWDVRIGAGYRHKFDNGWIGGAQVTVGSASDEPFASEDELVVRAVGLFRVPQGERNAWFFSVLYANDQDFLSGVPIPGIAYQYVPSDRFQAVIGVPFTSVRVRPLDQLTLEASYFPVRRVRARATYEVFRPLRAWAGFDWDSDRYFRADRQDKDDRLFYYEKRATGGLRFDLRYVGFEVAGGWAFDRFYFEGEGYSNRDDNRIDVHDGWFVAAGVSVRF